MCLSFLKSLFSKDNGSSQAPREEPKQARAADPNVATFRFNKIPESLSELKALPEARLDTPFKAAALTMLALCAYPKNKDAALEMLEFLKGPAGMSNYEKQFIKDRFMDKGKYIPYSYFEGASPANNYKPSEPFTLTIKAGAHAYDSQGYVTLELKSSGADNPRQIRLRKKESTGEYFLNEQFVMVGIREAKENDPWA